MGSKAKEFEKSGFTVDQMYKIGVVEVVITILFLIPQTSFIGAILLTGYLAGPPSRTYDSETIRRPSRHRVLVWIALGLRNPAIFRLARGGTGAPCPTPPKAE